MTTDSTKTEPGTEGKRLPAAISPSWVLNELAGMFFKDARGRDAYDVLKERLEAQTDAEVPVVKLIPKDRPDEDAEPVFTTNYRDENPKLHLFHLKKAIQVLASVQRAIDELANHSMTSAYTVVNAIFNAREALINSDAAYYDAHQMLLSISKEVLP